MAESAPPITCQAMSDGAVRINLPDGTVYDLTIETALDVVQSLAAVSLVALQQRTKLAAAAGHVTITKAVMRKPPNLKI